MCYFLEKISLNISSTVLVQFSRFFVSDILSSIELLKPRLSRVAEFMLGHLFLEVLSADKYPRIFLAQMEVFVYIFLKKY